MIVNNILDGRQGSLLGLSKMVKCANKPELRAAISLGADWIMTCAKPLQAKEKANHVIYDVDSGGSVEAPNIMEIRQINVELCVPQPIACNCEGLMNQIARQKETRIEHLDKITTANNFDLKIVNFYFSPLTGLKSIKLINDWRGLVSSFVWT